MYILERAEKEVVNNQTGYSRKAQSVTYRWGWKQVAVCENLEKLKKHAGGMHRILDDNLETVFRSAPAPLS